MSRRRRYQPRSKSTTFGLNITSMTDMFTILLVFLLQTYSTSDVQVEPERGLSLPLSNAQTVPVKSAQLSLSKNQLKLDGQLLAELDSGDFKSNDLEAHDPQFIVPLFRALEKVASEKKDLEWVKEGRLLLQADSHHEYKTIRRVLYTASMAGFPKMKIATVAGE